MALTPPSTTTPNSSTLMFQTLLTTILDLLGTLVYVICAMIAKLSTCLMK